MNKKLTSIQRNLPVIHAMPVEQKKFHDV